MAEYSKSNINGVPFDLKDAKAREKMAELDQRQTQTEGRLNGITNIPAGSEAASYPEIRAARVDGAGKSYDSLGEAMLAQVPKSAILDGFGNSQNEIMSQRAVSATLEPIDTRSRCVMYFYPEALNTFYLEEANKSGGKLFIYFASVLALRGSITSDYTLPEIAGQCGAALTTSTNGKEGCLEIPNDSAFCFDLSERKFKFVARGELKTRHWVILCNGYGKAWRMDSVILNALSYNMGKLKDGYLLQEKINQKSVWYFNPAALNTIYIEEANTSGGKLFIYFENVLALRGAFELDFSLSQIAENCGATLTTSAKGKTGCLEIPNNKALCFDISSRKFSFVDRTALTSQYMILLSNGYGKAWNVDSVILEALVYRGANSNGGNGIVNVKSFGALGNGTIDDTQAIQNAIDHSRANGGIVYFPAGTYNLGSALFNSDVRGIAHALEVYSNQTLMFDKGAVIKKGALAVTHLLYTHNETDAVGYDGAKNITIVGANVDGGYDEYTDACTLFNISHAKNVKIIDCNFYNNGGNWHSIEINSSKNCTVEGCTFFDNANSEDIQLDAANGEGNLGQNDDTVCKDILISNCDFNSVDHVAIGNHSPAEHTNTRIENCVFHGRGSKTRGYIGTVEHHKRVDVYNCTFRDSEIGVKIYTANSTVHDCRFENVTTPVTGGAISYNNMVNDVFTD